MITAAETVVEQLDRHVQDRLIADARKIIGAAPLVRPTTPGGTPMRVRVTAAGELGWVGDGAYRYDPHQRDGRPWPEIPDLWRGIADRAAGRHPWDSAILNWYDPGAALGWHQDRAEADHSLPIVTISLGDAASWAVAPDLDDGERGEPSRVRLDSGAVTLLAGESRMYWHTIERLIPAPLLSPFGATRGRLSITLRVAGAR